MKKWPWSAKEIEIISDLYFLWKKYREYENDRTKSNFDKCLTIFTIMRGLKENQYNGQTKSEFEKNYKRVADIIEKSAGDEEKAIRLASQQAAKITDEWKAINRALAAKSGKTKIHDAIFEVFFQRAYELGSVSKQEYREYKLDKLGL
jgi:hypothetical protein